VAYKEEPRQSSVAQLTYLGRGGTAVTYLREQMLPDGGIERRCIKKILPELRRDAEFMKLFRREVKIGLTLRHRNIVSMLEHNAAKGVLHFEFIDGVNLWQLLECMPGRRLPTDIAVYIAMQLCEAFEYAHSCSVIHRDVSASNVMISCFGEVKLLDFGIAKLVRGGREPKTAVRGRTQYMAPEHARNDPGINGRVDLFALGVLVYEMLAGRLPATGESDHEIYKQYLERRYPPVAEMVPGLAPELAEIVNRLLEPDPERRVASAEECFDAFARHAPSATVRRELGRRVRTALERVLRERGPSELLDQDEFEQSTDTGLSTPRELKRTAPPTAAAEYLLASEQSTRKLSAEPTTETLRRAIRRWPRWTRASLGLGLPLSAALVAMFASPGSFTNLAAFDRGARAGAGDKDTASGEVRAVVSPDERLNSAPSSINRANDAAQDGVPTVRPEALETAVATPTKSTGATQLVQAAEAPARHDAPRPHGDDKALVAVAPIEKGTIRVGVLPFSNVWIDGKSVGMSPRTVAVDAGTHVVGVGEKRPTVTRRVVVRAGEVREVFIDRSIE